MDILPYDEMRNKTREFYSSIGVNYPTELEVEAVASLTMPCYAKEFSEKKWNETICNNGSLATLGDAVCATFLLGDRFALYEKPEDLTNLKNEILSNKNFSLVGRKLLENKLFERNTDIKDGNKKDYATAFEAVIGFVFRISVEKAEKLFLRAINEGTV